MRRTLIQWTGCVVGAVVSTAMALHGQQTRVAAHVLDTKGTWHLDGTATPVAAGQGLIPGAKITAQSNQPGDAITIVQDDDMSRTHVACDGSPSNPCRNAILVQGLASASAGQSQFKNIVQAALSVLLSKPPAVGSHYALTLTRGLVSAEESEAVIALDPAQRIVLPPPPEHVRPGRYTISSSLVGQASPPTRQTCVYTSEGTWHPLPWSTPGLYQVSILNTAGVQVADTMLLVTPVAQYPAMLDSFNAIESRASTWTGPNARSDEHLFLRAFLLAESQQ
jgi:hypothetical protein